MSLIDSLLEPGSIELQVDAGNWKEAVKAGAGVLLKKKAISESYIDAIIKNTEELGAYYILDEGIAMPHARPEHGALANSFSLVTLANPVSFNNDEEPVSILITFSAVDAETHSQSSLLQIAELVENEEVMEQLKLVNSKDEAATILKTAF